MGTRQNLERGLGELGDAALHLPYGAQLDEQAAHRVHGASRQVRVADGGAQHVGGVPGAPVGGSAQAVGEQQGALAFPQVVARWFPGHRRITEHAQQVVPQLEGDSDVHPEAAVRGDQARPGPRDGGPEVQRAFRGVRRGLVPGHPQRRLR